MLPLVSVIIPYFNAAATLEEAIKSILAQSYPHWELWLVNDGSTDQSEIIAKGFQDPRLFHTGFPQNRGKSSARNEGLKLARGKYIAFLDADDQALPERLAQQVQYLEQHPKVDLLGGGFLLPGTAIRYRCYPWQPEYLKACLLFKCIVLQSTVMLRATTLRETGLTYDAAYESYAQDYKFFWDAIVQAWVLEQLPEFAVVHNPGQSASLRQQEQQLHFFRERLQKIGLRDTQLVSDWILEAFRGRVVLNAPQIKELLEFTRSLLQANNSERFLDQQELKAVLAYHWMRWWYYPTTTITWRSFWEVFRLLGGHAFLRFFYYQIAVFLKQLR